MNNKISLVEYNSNFYNKWNEFIQTSNNGTLFHRLSFLEYHKDRFSEFEKHLVWFKKEKIIAVLPMVVVNENKKKIIKSPYGGSFGGIVTKDSLNIKESTAIVECFMKYIENNNISKVNMVFPPYIYYNHPNNYIDFFLLKYGFRLANVDLTAYSSNVKDSMKSFSHSCRWSIRKALKNNITIEKSDDIEQFYHILVENRKKFNATPTHSLEDLRYLKKKKQGKLTIYLAYKDQIAISGCLTFEPKKGILFLFYWAHLKEYRQYRSVNLLLAEIIKKAYRRGIEYIDFGTQTVNMEPNISGSVFKESFGTTALFRNRYVWDITDKNEF